MFTSDQYELIDFGDGRKLERFADSIVDRPCPAAALLRKANPGRWGEADGEFHREHGLSGTWRWRTKAPPSWRVTHGQITFLLQPTPAGQVGVFPEQASNWDWIAGIVRRRLECAGSCRVLNLFAYTGGSTLAAAGAGAEVVHIDAAANMVNRARQNASESNLKSARIRWIAEDAARFVKREIRRGNRYEGVILDPPSYGHGPKGQPWKIDQQLEPLLIGCGHLLAEDRAFFLLTCHSPGFDAHPLKELTQNSLACLPEAQFTAAEMSLVNSSGRELPSGTCVRVTWDR